MKKQKKTKQINYQFTPAKISEGPTQFVIPLEEVNVPEGEDVTFLCQVSDDKAPVTWTKDGTKLEPSDKYILKKDGPKHTLLVKNATLDDRAVYAVELKDKKSEAPLFVEGKQNIRTVFAVPGFYEPRSEKTGLRGFHPGPTQTGLYSHRRWLEA